MRCDLIDAVVGDVADDDVELGGSLPIDVVESDAVAHDHLEVGRCFEDVPPDLSVAADDAVGVGHMRRDVFLLLWRQRDQLGVGQGQLRRLGGVRLPIGP